MKEIDPNRKVKKAKVSDTLVNNLHAAIGVSSNCEHSTSYHLVLQEAPNPCLHVSGSGLVSLPLAGTVARGIIQASDTIQGHTQDDVMTGYWEIGPNSVLFGNPNFEEYLKSKILPPLAAQLFPEWAEISFTNTSLEFEKLVLCESDFRLSPVSDEIEGNNCHGKMLVILPSHHTGGDIEVAEGLKSPVTRLIDISANSLFSTTIFAWSFRTPAARHKFRPITSGYRLAMLFNLIQPSPMPRVSEIVKVWREGGYKEMMNGESVFYLLGRRYSAEELKKGEQCLDEEDAMVVRALRGAAADHGLTLSLGDLKHANCAAVFSEECCESDNCDVSHDWDIGPDKKTQLLSAVDLRGKTVLSSEQVDGKLKGVYLEEPNLIPPNPFDAMEPDEGKENADSEECSASRYAIGLTVNRNFKYFRTALVLNPDPDFEEIRYQDKGHCEVIVKYLESFKERGVTKADPRYSRWIQRAMKQLYRCDADEKSFLYRFALEWEEPALLCAILPSRLTELTYGVETLSKPLKIFGFEQVQPGLDVAIAYTSSLEKRVELLRDIPSQCPSSEKRDNAQSWSMNQMQQIFEKYASDRSGKVEDIPYLSSLLQSEIWPAIQKSLIPSLLQHIQPIDFLASLIAALENLDKDLPREVLCDGGIGSTVGASSQKVPLPGSITKSQARKTIDLLLFRLPYSWTYTNSVPYKAHALVLINILRQLIQRSLTVPHCQHLFANIFQALPFSGKPSLSQGDFYPHIISEVSALLREHKIQHHSSPFAEFFRHVIGTYMSSVHEDKESVGRPNTQIRTVGCNRPHCLTCLALNQFLTNHVEKSLRFDSVTVGDGAHIQNAFTASGRKKRKLCDVTIDRLALPRNGTQMVRVVLVKVDDLNDPPGWASRKNATVKFLANITTDDRVLKKIMGDTWDDFALALEGTKKFPASKVSPPPTMSQKRTVDEMESGAGDAGQPDSKIRRL